VDVDMEMVLGAVSTLVMFLYVGWYVSIPCLLYFIWKELRIMNAR
jgi:hypothetical protein